MMCIFYLTLQIIQHNPIVCLIGYNFEMLTEAALNFSLANWSNDYVQHGCNLKQWTHR